LLSVFLLATVCLSPPVDGPVISPYAPAGQYAGHWGVDFSALPGSEVRAAASGRVTFAGSVAGMKSVTIEPIPGFKVSVSYLSAALVPNGARVIRGQVIARSGLPHGVPGVHFSTRIDGRYVDPMTQMGCKETDITRALRLVTPPQPYPRSRANRDTRRNLRSNPSRPSPCGGNCSPSSGFGRHPVRSRGRPLAKA